MKKNWPQEFDQAEVILQKKYVYDIICIFNCESDAENIFVYLNSGYKNIRSTSEKKQRNKLSFLDALITKDETGTQTQVGHKKLQQVYLLIFRVLHPSVTSRTCKVRAFELSRDW